MCAEHGASLATAPSSRRARYHHLRQGTRRPGGVDNTISQQGDLERLPRQQFELVASPRNQIFYLITQIAAQALQRTRPELSRECHRRDRAGRVASVETDECSNEADLNRQSSIEPLDRLCIVLGRDDGEPGHRDPVTRVRPYGLSYTVFQCSVPALQICRYRSYLDEMSGLVPERARRLLRKQCRSLCDCCVPRPPLVSDAHLMTGHGLVSRTSNVPSGKSPTGPRIQLGSSGDISSFRSARGERVITREQDMREQMAANKPRRPIKRPKQDAATFQRSARSFAESRRAAESCWCSAAGSHARAVSVHRATEPMRKGASGLGHR
jgi:hypothetical protein